jgi:hypothetical protein
MANPTIVRAATLTFLVNNPDVERPELQGLLGRVYGDDVAPADRPNITEGNDDLVYVQDADGFIAAIYVNGSEEGYRSIYHDAYDTFIANGGTLEA